jgi:EAL domain-containing protein (putative c-di-GMP-specific phosphodiesterase class I)
MPVDILKMDRSFMRGGETLQQSALATAVLALGETLKLQVVAEGIEHLEQWETMHALGCQFGQGFLFGRPMVADDVVEYLREHTTRSVAEALTHAA